MWLWIYWALIVLLVLFAVFTGGFKRKKILFFILIMLVSGGLVFYTGINRNNINSIELISSFFSDTEVAALSPGEELLEDSPNNNIWNVSNSYPTDIRQGTASFRFAPNRESLWWANNKSTIVYKNTRGDFLFSSLVRTRKSSDTLRFPDRALQFGGIMLRDPASEKANESYISISVGYRDNQLQIETKSTTRGETSASGFPWPSGDAELMIQSESGVYGLYARPYGTKGEWIRFQTYYRPDLPDRISAGLIGFSYGDNNHDLLVYFDGITIRRQDD